MPGPIELGSQDCEQTGEVEVEQGAVVEHGRGMDNPAQRRQLTPEPLEQRGQSRPVAGSEAQTWLHLAARARVWAECQRCLQPVALDLEVVRPLRFVAGEDAAAALDAESEDDVLALPRSLDLHELIEDELLLALPLIPMHNQCPQGLPMSVGEASVEAAAEAAPKPFAALAALKRER